MTQDECPHCNSIVQFISEEKLQFSCGTTILRVPTPKMQRSEVCLETPEELETRRTKNPLSSRVVSYSTKFY